MISLVIMEYKNITNRPRKEFDNNLLEDYCKNNNIQLITSGVRHPTTNGVVEVVHKDIKNSLLAEKLKLKKIMI